MLEVTEKRKAKAKQNHNSNLNDLPLSLYRKNSMKMEITTTTMRIIEVIIEAIDTIGTNTTVGGHIEGPSKGKETTK